MAGTSESKNITKHNHCAEVAVVAPVYGHKPAQWCLLGSLNMCNAFQGSAQQHCVPPDSLYSGLLYTFADSIS